MDMARLYLIGIVVAMLSGISCDANASLPKEDPYVDVYVPAGIDGETKGELRVDTPNYAFTYNCGRFFRPTNMHITPQSESDDVHIHPRPGSIV